MKIGILAVQGAFIEHEKMLEGLGAECVKLRKKNDIGNIKIRLVWHFILSLMMIPESMKNS